MNLLGAWKGTSNSAVLGSGLFHPTEAGKEKAVRFRHIEHVITIHEQEDRNFVGSIEAVNHEHKEVLLGAFSKDFKSGVMVNEHGTFTFHCPDLNTLAVCYTQIVPHALNIPLVAGCFELLRQ